MKHSAWFYEKRWSPRRQTIFPIHCQLSMNEETRIAWLRDFSSTGARVISNLPLMVGDEFTLTLTLPQQARSETLVAKVRWKQGQLLGVEFKYTSRT